MADVRVPASQAAPTPERGLRRARPQSRQTLPTSTNLFQNALRNTNWKGGKKKDVGHNCENMVLEQTDEKIIKIISG